MTVGGDLGLVTFISLRDVKEPLVHILRDFYVVPFLLPFVTFELPVSLRGSKRNGRLFEANRNSAIIKYSIESTKNKLFETISRIF